MATTKKQTKKPAAKRTTKPATTTKKPARKPVKAKKKAVVVPAKKKPVKRKNPAGVRKKSGIFDGATEIAVTENKIAVTRKMSGGTKGRFEQSEIRTYHDRTAQTDREFEKLMNERLCKKVIVKLK